MGLQKYCQAQGGIVAPEIVSRHMTPTPEHNAKIAKLTFAAVKKPSTTFDTNSTLFRQTCRRIGKGIVNGEDIKKVN